MQDENEVTRRERRESVLEIDGNRRRFTALTRAPNFCNTRNRKQKKQKTTAVELALVAEKTREVLRF